MDEIGDLHLILFGDFKTLRAIQALTRVATWYLLFVLCVFALLPRQLPPCSSQAPFIRLPAVHNFFSFRVLRENRRVVKDENGTAARQADLENFHRVLTNISEGKATQRVRDFIALVLDSEHRARP